MDKILFTPGPLTTSKTVKEAMLMDVGSRDTEFMIVLKEIRQELLRIAGVSQADGYEAVLMQGSGTFGLESLLSSIIPHEGHLLILVNGAYGERLEKIAKVHDIEVSVIRSDEFAYPHPSQLEDYLQDEPYITHVAVIHCETTTGIINPIKEYSEVCSKFNKSFIVDAMSSFGAVPINMKELQIDALVSSSNKCIEGVPGFSFVLIRRNQLILAGGKARTLSLDLHAQWVGLENEGQFRFTPPTHALLAFRQALKELECEGGVSGRAMRYIRNHKILTDGMYHLGFKEFLNKQVQSYIITSFLYPKHSNFDFPLFYSGLSKRDQVIYPGKLSKFECFRIGNIGCIKEEDIHRLLYYIDEVLNELDVKLYPFSNGE